MLMFTIHEAEKNNGKGNHIGQRDGIVDMRGFSFLLFLFQGASIVCFRKKAFGGSGYRGTEALEHEVRVG